MFIGTISEVKQKNVETQTIRSRKTPYDQSNPHRDKVSEDARRSIRETQVIEALIGRLYL